MVKVHFLLAVSLNTVTAASNLPQEDALLQTWNNALDGSVQGAGDTPITRVVNLLKEMQSTLKKEMDEDEELYEKLACWCNNNKYEKNQAIEAAEAKIAQLEAEIESLTAKTAELRTTIKETQDELAADKNELAEATALRNKQLKAFQGEELAGIQNIENLKAAITVLGKHHGAFPQISFLALQKGGRNPFGADHENNKLESQLDAFMRKNNFDSSTSDMHATDREVQKFLQEQKVTDDTQSMAQTIQVHFSEQKVVNNEPPVVQEAAPVQQATPIWSASDKATVEKAIHTASFFLQAHGRQTYNPSYSAQSGEILGVLKQLKEEMEGDLSEAQKTEVSRAEGFKELREAKTAEIAAGEKQLEEKKEELAQAEMDLANDKEDLEEVQAALSEDQKFMINLVKTCEEADKNFEMRKKSRLSEIQAVSETLKILTSDEARDSFNGAYKFVQLSSTVTHRDSRRTTAARTLRTAAAKTGNPDLSMMASSVELDAFTKVKKMIDDMVATLKTQQADEVKKKDWCDSELQENEMQTMKAEALKSDQETQISNLEVAIKTLTDEIATAKSQIQDMQLNLQRASEQRRKENLDFQKTVADQKATQEILAKALDKLATFYDKESLVQQKGHAKQTPPVAQMKYAPSGGASGVMSMIEKLIYDAKELEADAVKGESEAQSQYETLVADTNASVADLQKAIVTKTESLAESEKQLTETKEALEGTMADLESLNEYKSDMHKDCDYILKNFQIRQDGRAQEIEALQQAKQILSGASS